MVRKISDKEMAAWNKAAKEAGAKEYIKDLYNNSQNRKMISGEFVEKYCK